MKYEVVAAISQVTSLFLFIAMFAAVIVYVLWPKNAPRLEAAQRRALGLPSSASNERGRK